MAGDRSLAEGPHEHTGVYELGEAFTAEEQVDLHRASRGQQTSEIRIRSDSRVSRPRRGSGPPSLPRLNGVTSTAAERRPEEHSIARPAARWAGRAMGGPVTRSR